MTLFFFPAERKSSFLWAIWDFWPWCSPSQGPCEVDVSKYLKWDLLGRSERKNIAPFLLFTGKKYVNARVLYVVRPCNSLSVIEVENQESFWEPGKMFPLSPVILACIDLHLIPVLQRDKQSWRQVEQTCHPGDQGNPLGTKPCDKTKLQSCQNISLGYPWRAAVFAGPWEVFFRSLALRSSHSLSRANGNSFVIFINYFNFWPLS